MKILIYGLNGYIGQILKQYFEKNHIIIVSTKAKINTLDEIIKDIKVLKPDRIISSIGLTKTKNNNSTIVLNSMDMLYDNIMNNLFIHHLIATACIKFNIHFTYIGTGCIYSQTKKYNNFIETDTPNFKKSAYSIVKGFTDQIMNLNKDKILTIRLRQCLNNDNHSRNFLNKFLSFQKLSDIPNSYTVIPSMFPILIDMIEKEITGVYNFVNTGSISPKDIVNLYIKEKNIDKKYTVADRNFILNNYSNNILLTNKLEKLYKIENINSALLKLISSL